MRQQQNAKMPRIYRTPKPNIWRSIMLFTPLCSEKKLKPHEEGLRRGGVLHPRFRPSDAARFALDHGKLLKCPSTSIKQWSNIPITINGWM